jgi:two-component system, OmpR family, response regulator RegX3
VERQRILIVQHDPITCQIMNVALDAGEQQCVVARSGAEALAVFTERHTALLLLDTQLPDIDGFALLHALRVREYSGPVIFVSTLDALQTKLQAFRNGADDFLSIPFEPLELAVRVEAVLRRFRSAARAAAEAYIRVDDAELHLGTLTYRSDAVGPTLLGPTELRLLECLMRNARVAVSRAPLARHVWGYGVADGALRIDATVHRVRHVIEPEPTRPRYLHTVRGVGYMFQPLADHNGCGTSASDSDHAADGCDDA